MTYSGKKLLLSLGWSSISFTSLMMHSMHLGLICSTNTAWCTGSWWNTQFVQCRPNHIHRGHCKHQVFSSQGHPWQAKRNWQQGLHYWCYVLLESCWCGWRLVQQGHRCQFLSTYVLPARWIQITMDLPVTVAILFECTTMNSNSPGRLSWLQMALALCTKMNSTKCLLVRWMLSHTTTRPMSSLCLSSLVHWARSISDEESLPGELEFLCSYIQTDQLQWQEHLWCSQYTSQREHT